MWWTFDPALSGAQHPMKAAAMHGIAGYRPLQNGSAWYSSPELQQQALWGSRPGDGKGEGFLAEDAGIGLDQSFLWVSGLCADQHKRAHGVGCCAQHVCTQKHHLLHACISTAGCPQPLTATWSRVQMSLPIAVLTDTPARLEQAGSPGEQKLHSQFRSCFQPNWTIRGARACH